MRRDIHRMFGLSYAGYLVLQRSALQSMPTEWQHKFVELLDELEDKGYHKLLPEGHSFVVKMKDRNGKFIKDPLAEYGRGRRDLNRELQEYNNRGGK